LTIQIYACICFRCERYLPEQLSAQCDEFVEDYADAIIAMLTQQIDPSEVSNYFCEAFRDDDHLCALFNLGFSFNVLTRFVLD